jgi:glycosyltransferase involved in cell wall biosynthesis
LIDQKNAGPAAARNTGLQKIKGEFVMFFDSDDEVDLKIVEKMLGRLQKTNSDLIACGFKYHRLSDDSVADIFTNPAATRLKCESLSSYVVRLLGNDGRLYSVANKIFRTDNIKNHQLKFDNKLNFGEDLIFVLNYLRYATKINYIYEPLYRYHYGTGTSTVKNSSLKYENWQQNWHFLTNWFQPQNQYETDNLNWIKYRWSYSYCLAVCRSGKTNRQRRILLKQAVKDKTLPKIGHIRNIGREKYLLEKLYRIARKTTFTLLIFSVFIVKIKKSDHSSGNF